MHRLVGFPSSPASVSVLLFYIKVSVLLFLLLRTHSVIKNCKSVVGKRLLCEIRQQNIISCGHTAKPISTLNSIFSGYTNLIYANNDDSWSCLLDVKITVWASQQCEARWVTCLFTNYYRPISWSATVLREILRLFTFASHIYYPPHQTPRTLNPHYSPLTMIISRVVQANIHCLTFYLRIKLEKVTDWRTPSLSDVIF